jgi:hypothetical protein
MTERVTEDEVRDGMWVLVSDFWLSSCMVCEPCTVFVVIGAMVVVAVCEYGWL